MKKLFYNFCLGCISAFIALVAGNLIAYLIISYKDGFQGFDLIISMAKDIAMFATPTMLFCGAISVVSHNNESKEKQEGTGIPTAKHTKDGSVNRHLFTDFFYLK